MVIFSDETHFMIGKDNSAHAWRPNAEIETPCCLGMNIDKSSPKLSCMSEGRMFNNVGTLVVIESTVNYIFHNAKKHICVKIFLTHSEVYSLLHMLYANELCVSYVISLRSRDLDTF